MGIQIDRIAAFYDAVRALTYTEMLEVAGEVSSYMEAKGEITLEGATGEVVANALCLSSEGKPTNHKATRSG